MDPGSGHIRLFGTNPFSNETWKEHPKREPRDYYSKWSDVERERILKSIEEYKLGLRLVCFVYI